MLDLRRRIQADPASIAFAQLAEECRRVGSNEEAADICRAGLARNPGYLSARVTLGRALIELGQLDAAKTELEIVVAGVPDNLAAIRGLAEILQRRGQMKEALEYYKRALDLARHDRDLEHTVERITQEVAPPAPQPQGPAVSIEEIFNFDTLIDQLGLGPEVPVVPEAPAAASATPPEVGPTSASAAEGGYGATASASAAEGRYGATAPELVDELDTSEGGPELVDELDTSEGGPELSAEPAPSLEAEPAPSLEELFAEPLSASTDEGGFGETASASAAEFVEEPPTSVVGAETDPLEDFFAEIPTAPSAEPTVTEAPLEEYFAEESPASEGGLDESDSLAVMERQLRELEQQRTADERRARMELAERRRGAMVVALETWLSAIVADRERTGA